MKVVHQIALALAVLGPLFLFPIETLVLLEVLLGVVVALQGVEEKVSNLLLAGIAILLLIQSSYPLVGITWYVYAVVLLSSAYAFPQVLVGAWKDLVS